MLPEELNVLAQSIMQQKAEGQTIEVKSAHQGCPERLYDTLSSFSNQDQGGIIVFGIDEKADFALTEIYDLQDLQKKVTEQCNQMEPPVRAVFTVAQIQDSFVCSAEIPGIDYSVRPCYYKGRGRLKGSYIRVGDADLPMTDYELYGFEAYRKHLHDDERPVERADISILDHVQLQNYLLQKRMERPGFSQLSDEQAMEMLNITRDGVPTLAAVMNFCFYPQGYLPQLAITAVVVPGTEIGEHEWGDPRFLDNKRLEGTIKTMVEEAISFCKRNMTVQTIIDPQTGKRTDRTEYPIEAIREAILNALIHRDYSYLTEGTPVQINFFSNRLEIHSPGSLYGRMTVEQLGFTKPDLRNPALAVMTEMLVGAENRYSGIPTIRREMKAHGLPEPVFENRRNEFVVTLYNQSCTQEATQKVEHRGLLAFCMQPRTRQEIAAFLGIKSVNYAIDRYVKPLVETHVLGMTIPERPRSQYQKYFTVDADT